MSKYWNKVGQFQAEYNNLYGKLVPPVGNSDTVHGECLRAVSKIYYECFNNGFCNNVSGAAVFLSKTVPGASDLLTRELMLHTTGYTLSGKSEENMIHPLLDSLVDTVVSFVLTTENAPNTVDMYDLELEEYQDEMEICDEEY